MISSKKTISFGEPAVKLLSPEDLKKSYNDILEVQKSAKEYKKDNRKAAIKK